MLVTLPVCVYIMQLLLAQVVATLSAGFPRGQDSVPSAPAEDGSVECVAFTPTLPLAVSGSLSGVMAVWDLPTQQLRLVCQHEVCVYGGIWPTNTAVCQHEVCVYGAVTETSLIAFLLNHFVTGSQRLLPKDNYYDMHNL